MGEGGGGGGGGVAAQAVCDFKTSTILVYMILNGKGSNWLWSTWAQYCFQSLSVLLFVYILYIYIL